MFSFFSNWRTKSETASPTLDSLPLPVTAMPKRNRQNLHLQSTPISPPIPFSPPQSLTGFDDASGAWGYSQPSPTRVGPSNVAWLNSSRSFDEEKYMPRYENTLPAVVRLDVQPHVHPMGRSISLPPMPSSGSEDVNDSNRWGLKLHTNEEFSQSTQSLRLDSRPLSYTDVYGSAYDYPLAKQLSPIAEQDYFSPESLRHTKSLPHASDKDLYATYSQTNPSPGGSQSSEVARPSPVYSSPFITRQLNRTISQTSSRTHVSTASSIPRPSLKSVEVPIIPPLDLRPPFPGPHPSPTGPGPQLRPRRSTVVTMPTITGSSEGYIEEDYVGDDNDCSSLHAESFVTATSKNSAGLLAPPEQDMDAGSGAEIHSVHSRLPSASESFIARRWERDAALGFDAPTFRAKRQWVNVTPAFWTFWLGFIFPILWLVGGWHFSHFGEQPPRLTFWEFYFNAGYWKEQFCGGRNKKKDLRAGQVYPPLPRWVAEKQVSDDGRARLNDPKRSLRGISFGYPFIPRSVTVEKRQGIFKNMLHRLVTILEKPNRLFDMLYGIKLKEVRGRPESGRRMFDPWIQRCRYAFCYALILLAIGLCAASTYLVIFNTRQLR